MIQYFTREGFNQNVHDYARKIDWDMKEALEANDLPRIDQIKSMLRDEL